MLSNLTCGTYELVPNKTNMAVITSNNTSTQADPAQASLGERCHALAQKNQARRKELADQEWQKHCQEWLDKAIVRFERKLEQVCMTTAANGHFLCDFETNDFPDVPTLPANWYEEGLGCEKLVNGNKYATFGDCAQEFFLRYVDLVIAHIAKSHIKCIGTQLKWSTAKDHLTMLGDEKKNVECRCSTLQSFKELHLDEKKQPPKFCFHLPLYDKPKRSVFNVYDGLVHGVKFTVDWASCTVETFAKQREAKQIVRECQQQLNEFMV